MHSVDLANAYLLQIQPRNLTELITRVQYDLRLAIGSLTSYFELCEMAAGSYGDVEAIREAIKLMPSYIDSLPTVCTERAEPHPTYHLEERPVYEYLEEFVQYAVQIIGHVEFMEWGIKNVGVLSIADEQLLHHMDAMTVTTRHMVDLLQALNIYHHQHRGE